MVQRKVGFPTIITLHGCNGVQYKIKVSI